MKRIESKMKKKKNKVAACYRRGHTTFDSVDGEQKTNENKQKRKLKVGLKLEIQITSHTSGKKELMLLC